MGVSAIRPRNVLIVPLSPEDEEVPPEGSPPPPLSARTVASLWSLAETFVNQGWAVSFYKEDESGGRLRDRKVAEEYLQPTSG